MMDQPCPAADVLRRYLIGDYSDEQGSAIEHHLAGCAACEDTLAGFDDKDDTNDSLLRHLPLAASLESERNDANSHPAWLDRLKAGLPEVAVATDAGVGEQSDVVGTNPISGLDSYELLGVLGSGGMGVVFHARHRQLGREVAIKIVRPKLASALNVRDRFEQEIRILGRMKHPGIVMATDAGRVGPAAYLVMELIDGIDLALLVREHGPFSIAQATEIARQVAEALAEAHSSNAVHRDVKPSNVMLDRDGRAKLLDFGLAHLSKRANEHDETSLGHVLGTLDYMAPEQAEGKPVESSTDLYGLGALLFYLLTGDPPHSSSPDRTLLQQLKSITTTQPRSLSSVRVDVPDDLSQLVAQLLNRDPNERPQDANQVAKSLSSWAARDSLASLTKEIKPKPPSDNPDEVDRSLCALLGDVPTTDSTVQSGTKPKRDWGIFHSVGSIAAAVAGLAAIWFGITVLLDTPTGKIQIHSEVAGIQVELLDEQDQPTELKIENNQKTTELKVGKYRLRILEPHGGVRLDKRTLTLVKGETVIATVRRFNNSDPPTAALATASPLASPEVAVARNDLDEPIEVANEPIYKGHPRSFWIKRFEAETNPPDKVAAGEALLSFVKGSPAEQVEQRVAILGKLYEAAYGSKLENKVLTISGCATECKSAWPNTDPLKELRSLVSRQLSQLPDEQVVEKLVEMVSGESPLKSAHALMALSKMAESNTKPIAAVAIDALGLDAPPTVKLQKACLLIRAGLFYVADDSQKERLVRDMTQVAKESVDIDVVNSQPDANPDHVATAKRNRSFERAWLRCSLKWHNGWVSIERGRYRVIGVDRKLLAQVVLYDIVNNDFAFSHHFPSVWTTKHTPFRESTVSSNRERAFPLWEAWVDVANEWLAENAKPENQEEVNRVLKTFRLVLPTRLESDSWKVSTTANLMTEHLKSYYEATEPRHARALDAHDLLTNIILCGGSIPDFVIANPPANPDIRARLSALSEVLNSGISYEEYVRRHATAKGLIQLAPYETVKCILTATKPPRYGDGSPISPIRMIRDASNVKTLDEVPPINPLLLMSITSELSKEHGAVIDYLGLRDKKRLFLNHLHDALSCPTVVGPIAKRWHRQMYANASDEKKKEIEFLTPSIKDWVTSEAFHSSTDR